MEIEYNVKHFNENTWEVVKSTIIFGERLDAYNSSPNTRTDEIIFRGSISDCEAYIRLAEKKESLNN